MDYPIVIAPLPEEEGGGFIGCVPDLPGCISDGDTQEEALKNTNDAIVEWIAEYTRLGRDIPAPGSAAKAAHQRHKKLLQALRETLREYSDLDQKLDDIRTEVSEVRERLEHHDQWARFADLTGLPIVDDGETIKGHC